MADRPWTILWRINLQEMGLFVGRIFNVNAERLVDVQNADFPLTQ